MSESQLHTDDYAATGAVDGEEADVTDETSGSADEPAEADALVSENGEGAAAEPAEEAGAARSRCRAAETDAVAEFNRELRMLPGDWYVVHSYAGYENRVKTNLESRITSLNMEDYIFQIEVPTHQVTEIKSGKKQTVNEKVLPGYILVRMDLTDESWAVVRNTPGVTGFVGLSSRPSPLPLGEVASLLAPAPGGNPGAGGGRQEGVSGIRGRRVGYRYGRTVRDASRDRERGQPGHAEAAGARVDLRQGDARGTVV